MGGVSLHYIKDSRLAFSEFFFEYFINSILSYLSTIISSSIQLRYHRKKNIWDSDG
jgi:hypothetical protein